MCVENGLLLTSNCGDVDPKAVTGDRLSRRQFSSAGVEPGIFQRYPAYLQIGHHKLVAVHLQDLLVDQCTGTGGIEVHENSVATPSDVWVVRITKGNADEYCCVAFLV